jgi:hypothetical protein
MTQVEQRPSSGPEPQQTVASAPTAVPDVIIPASGVDRSKLYRLLQYHCPRSKGAENFRVEVSRFVVLPGEFATNADQLRMNYYKIYRTNMDMKPIQFTSVRPPNDYDTLA